MKKYKVCVPSVSGRPDALVYRIRGGTAYSLAMLAYNPPTLPHETYPHRDDPLPVSTQEDVDGFIALYWELYGVELEPVRAQETLGGLMVFLYLTRRSAGSDAAVRAGIGNETVVAL